VHSLVWDEAQECQGRDPDFHRRDLWEAIVAGEYPEYELGVQLVDESDEFAFDFDLLDPTKLIPEEQVPVRPVGRMVLDRNPEDYFAETEQVAFHLGNAVPGIDFTDDPLLQARMLSYLDSQTARLGGPNFAQLPVNRPLAPVRTNQRGGYHQSEIHSGAGYSPNSLGGGCPVVSGSDGYAFSHHPERVDGDKIRKRSFSFEDHYGQPALFWHSLSGWERHHLVEAFRYELGRVGSAEVRARAVGELARVDHDLASAVAEGVGVARPPVPESRPPRTASAALSQEHLKGDGSLRSRRIAVLVTDGMDAGPLTRLREELADQGAVVEAIAHNAGKVTTGDGEDYPVDRALPTTASVLYDAVLLPGGPTGTPKLAGEDAPMRFVRGAYRHGKPIGAVGSGVGMLMSLEPEGLRIASEHGQVATDRGVVTCTASGLVGGEEFARAFRAAVAAHRHWDRPPLRC
jgi:catalase